ncbi:hypothetical protein MALU111345_20280 [Marinicrinis lubricantis]
MMNVLQRAGGAEKPVYVCAEVGPRADSRNGNKVGESVSSALRKQRLLAAVK